MSTDALTRRFQALLEGQYRIERELGRGGMATVYLAHDLRHDRAVAIKLLQPELTTAATAERFLREIQITAKLQHPHILTLIDSGARDGLVYYVMPHVEGESLRERLIWEKQCHVDRAVAVTRQIAAALQYAHDRGVIHRDIKPENILLSAGQAMLADFGIARAIRDSGQQMITAVGMPLGTPAYMSPEQAAGRQEIDHRSDIYSLGCVLFEMLAGKPPFVAPTVAKVMQLHLTEPPPSVCECRSAAPGALDEIVRKALAKDPADRFQTAQELADALGLVEAAETLERATPTGARRVITPGSLPGIGQPYGSTPSSLKRMLIASGAIGGIVIAGIALSGDRGPPPGPPPGVVAAVPPAAPAFLTSVGVKPLDVIGGDSTGPLISAGITEEVTTQLAKIRQVRVISRSTMEAVARKGWTARQVADSLGIRYLLEGSIQPNGREVAVSLSLVDAIEDTPVWSDSYRMPVKDILMIRQDIARRVVEALATKVRGLAVRGADSSSRNPEAVEARAHGLELWRSGNEDQLAEAIESFERALALDSSYAQAAAELSDALRYYVNLGFNRRRDPYRSLADAIRWAERAVRLDPSLALGYAARGAARIETGVRRDLALADLERAVGLAPSDGTIRVYRGIALSRVGRYDDALREMETAAVLDPLNGATRGGGLALTALAARRYLLAAEQAALASARDPGFSGWRTIEAIAHMLGGHPERCVAMNLTGSGIPVTAICHHRLGQTDRARAIVDSLEAAGTREPLGIYTMGFLGAYRAELGDPAGAATWLERAFERSPLAFDFRFFGSGMFDRVRDDPQFQRRIDAVLARVRARFS